MRCIRQHISQRSQSRGHSDFSGCAQSTKTIRARNNTTNKSKGRIENPDPPGSNCFKVDCQWVCAVLIDEMRRKLGQVTSCASANLMGQPLQCMHRSIQARGTGSAARQLQVEVRGRPGGPSTLHMCPWNLQNARKWAGWSSTRGHGSAHRRCTDIRG